MKGLLKLVLIGVIIYYAYKYYVRNFTVEGKKDYAKQQAEENRDIINSTASELKEEMRSRLYSICNGIPSFSSTISVPFLPIVENLSPTYLSGSDGGNLAVNMCRIEADNRVNAIDWQQEAKEYLSLT